MHPITNQTVQVLTVYVVLPLLAALATIVVRRRRPRPAPDRDDPDDIRARLRDIIRDLPERPRLLTTAQSSQISMLVEARLLSGCPSLGLAEAEQQLLANPGDTGACVAMAKALLYCQQEDEARATLRWAQRMGADDPEFDYLQARLRGPDIEALHLSMRACRRDPGYAEALYLCARLGRALGYGPEAERLLREIEPLMALSVERHAYRRDLLALVQPADSGGLLVRLWRAVGRSPAPAPQEVRPDVAAPV